MFWSAWILWWLLRYIVLKFLDRRAERGDIRCLSCELLSQSLVWASTLQTPPRSAEDVRPSECHGGNGLQARASNRKSVLSFLLDIVGKRVQTDSRAAVINFPKQTIGRPISVATDSVHGASSEAIREKATAICATSSFVRPSIPSFALPAGSAAVAAASNVGGRALGRNSSSHQDMILGMGRLGLPCLVPKPRKAPRRRHPRYLHREKRYDLARRKEACARPGEHAAGENRALGGGSGWLPLSPQAVSRLHNNPDHSPNSSPVRVLCVSGVS
jgi:hypothetical protein